MMTTFPEPLDNLTAWAVSHGFDPLIDYVNGEGEGEGAEPPPAPEPERVVFYPEGWPLGQYSKNFRANEFKCRGTGTMVDGGMDPKLIEALQLIRNYYGVPVTVNSGYRSKQHNANVGGAKNSQHLYGRAADFRVKGVSPAKVYALLDPLWPGGLGKYPNFTHIDTRPNRTRWSG